MDEELILGHWYALIEDGQEHLAQLGMFVGMGAFIDDDGHEFSAGDFDRFVKQA